MEIKCGVAEIQKDRNTHFVSKVYQLPNEKEAVYEALDKRVAWETEFPLIAAAKALQIFKKRSQWLRVIQVYSVYSYSCFVFSSF
ncbi:hypothetical protein ERO13_A12G050500v2 [Gossypium hirsutum]|nr:hypothetical protein ERO13_A12G050500v2 [Gossypium hirsutum]